MNDLKYLAAFSTPFVAMVALYLGGYYTFLTPMYAFGIIPILELMFSQNTANLSPEEVEKKSANSLFDWLLYLNIPIVFGLLIVTLINVSTGMYETYELVGLIFSTGIVLGSNGINVAHELGHRQTKVEQIMAKILLLPSLYMHFFVEHNFGHHLHAATKEDPATARYNQVLYSFWFTSTARQYINAWKIQQNLRQREKFSFFSPKNNMFWFTILQIAYVAATFYFFGTLALIFILGSAVVSFLLLETINYIEHYGLQRKKLPSGRYERVREIHSWNSNHTIGRIVLYELTRHSDHHYKASKKYQLLDCHEESPQMPFGYPTSMVMALIPPLWFKVMNKRIPAEMNSVTK
ncbi:alkane 1-monooxygenase [Kordia sp. YSTF-M3]|uniref:Alkane 1-monooxygenase n=1 Tax=Kordia aestuariivivens TaxID=2759037 RepID=A0ABR7QA32_9FLAO|nr:alkane 1-monooxygenase [Kordia aestuariivivens]MBC8755390.1 alkane 1-monooxygenase [Kordia aestuariivivens]